MFVLNNKLKIIQMIAIHNRILFLLVAGISFFSCSQNEKYLEMQVEVYQDKMEGAWIGQMAGVGWGLPTEFDFVDSLIPSKNVPVWDNNMINQQGNDDLYVEMTFMSSMEKYGLDVSIRQAGIDFANTGYTLWAANLQGRKNLRYGIAPPESSHPEYNKNADDIDYQIEADFSGIIAPGMPNVAIELGEKFGRLMNYGDGLYGGQFVGGMYAAAYFSDDIYEVIEAGLACIPEESIYSQCVRDVIQWYQENPGDFEKTWNLIMDKYFRTLDHQPFARANKEVWPGIDAKINGAFIVMGLLYGEGDMEKTIVYSMRCGLDSDCNPSNAAGVLGTMMGYQAIPEKFKVGLDRNKKFSYSEYTFTTLLEVSEKFTREYIVRNGGEVTAGKNGREVFRIIKQQPVPSVFQPSHQPGPFDPDNRYTAEEMDQILAWSEKHFEQVVQPFGISLDVQHCGKGVNPGLIDWNGKTSVLPTVPMSDKRSVRLSIKEKLTKNARGKKPWFVFHAGHNPEESWKLSFRSGSIRMDTLVGTPNSKNGWMNFEVPLSEADEINIEMQASVAADVALNYWSNFEIIYK